MTDRRCTWKVMSLPTIAEAVTLVVISRDCSRAVARRRTYLAPGAGSLRTVDGIGRQGTQRGLPRPLFDTSTLRFERLCAADQTPDVLRRWQGGCPMLSAMA